MGGVCLMAEFFTVLFAGIGKAAAAVGGAGAAAGAGGGLTSIFSLGATVAGGLASIASGRQQASALEAQAAQDRFQATQDELAGRQDAVNAIRKLNQEMGAGVVAGFASGLQSSGSTMVALEEAQKAGERAADMSRLAGEASAAARRVSAQQRLSDAKAAKTAGIFGAIQGGLQYGARQYQRG